MISPKGTIACIAGCLALCQIDGSPLPIGDFGVYNVIDKTPLPLP